MTDRHAEAQELLAGYALQSLSGEDAAEADRLLAEHVPGCSECRQMLDAFQAVAGELALDAETIPPPDPLLPRIHREMEPRGRSAGRWTSGRLVAAAASVVLVVGAGGLAIRQLGDRKTAQVPAADYLAHVVGLQSALGAATASDLVALTAFALLAAGLYRVAGR